MPDGAPAASDFLESLPDETVVTTPPLALVKALGLGRALASVESGSDGIRGCAPT